MENTPGPRDSAEKKEGGDPRLKKALRMVRNILLGAGVVSFYGGTFAYEINRGLEKRHEREEQSARIDREIAQEEKQQQQWKEGEKQEKELAERIKEGKIDDIRTKEGVISQEDWQRFMKDGYPAGWFEGVSIHQKPGLLSMKGYNLPGVAGASAAPRQHGSEIDFYDNSNQIETRSMIELMSHESCHTAEQRLARTDSAAHAELRTQLDQRVASADRTISGYVESIANENEQDRKKNKATEYWAEICGQYFHDPDTLNIKDYRLVDALVKKQDPSFSLRDARLERGILIGQLRTKEPLG